MPTFCDRQADTDVEALEAIRAAVHGLLPNWQNPERFHIQRSGISGALTKLLRLIGSEPRSLNGRAVALRNLPTASRAATLTLAAQVFAPPVAPPEPPQGAVPKRAVRRRHSYPLPPGSLHHKGACCDAETAPVEAGSTGRPAGRFFIGMQ
jgi:hypothetical protein